MLRAAAVDLESGAQAWCPKAWPESCCVGYRQTTSSLPNYKATSHTAVVGELTHRKMNPLQQGLPYAFSLTTVNMMQRP